MGDDMVIFTQLPRQLEPIRVRVGAQVAFANDIEQARQAVLAAFAATEFEQPGDAMDGEVLGGPACVDQAEGTVMKAKEGLVQAGLAKPRVLARKEGLEQG